MGFGRLRRVALWLVRALSQGEQCGLPLAGWLFLPPGWRYFCTWGVSVDTLGGAYEAAVADDDGGRMVGVAGPSARTAQEARLGFAVLIVPVPAAWARLAGAGRWDGNDVDAAFLGVVGDDALVCAQGDVGECLVEAGFAATAFAVGRAHQVTDLLALDDDSGGLGALELFNDCGVGLPLFIGVASAVPGQVECVGSLAALGVCLLALEGASFQVRPSVWVKFRGGEAVAVGERHVVLDTVVNAEKIVDVGVGEDGGFRVVAFDGDVELVLSCAEGRVGGASAVRQFNELHRDDVVWQGPASAEYVVHSSDGERVATSGLDELCASDGEGLGAVLAGTVLEGTAVGPGIPGMWLLAVFDGFRYALEALLALEHHELVGDGSGLAALLVDVVGGVGLIGVGVAPGGDSLVESEA